MDQRFSNQPDERILAMLRKGEPAALLLVAATAVLILGLWFSPRFAAVVPPIWSKMVPNTGIGLLCAVSSLALSVEGQSPLWLRLSQAAGLAVLVLGIVTLIEYAAGVSLGIDKWLPTDGRSRFPGRPSPQASLGFALLGTNLLLVREYLGRRALLADLFAGAFVAFCLVMIAGRVYGALDLVGLDASTLLAPQTSFCFSLLAFVVVARRAKRGGLLAVLVNMGIGSRIVRLVLPGVVLLPFAFFTVVAYLIDSKAISAPYVYALAAAAASFAILCTIIAMAWRINAMERQLRDLSLRDELTKLYNRRGFYVLAGQAFREATRADTGMTLLFFDLDGLKRANDTAGHEAGSKLIQALASLLVGTFRESDIIGRIGGDEFAVSTIRDQGQAGEALARLERSVADFNKSGGVQRPLLNFSVGVAQKVNGSSESFEDLIARADTMMYQDKAARHFQERSAPS
jgi:diguanylate cyclase (GGDEF)-like protein